MNNKELLEDLGEQTDATQTRINIGKWYIFKLNKYIGAKVDKHKKDNIDTIEELNEDYEIEKLLVIVLCIILLIMVNIHSVTLINTF